MRKWQAVILILMLALSGCAGGAAGVPETGGKAVPTQGVASSPPAPTLTAPAAATSAAPARTAPSGPTAAKTVSATQPSTPEPTVPATCALTREDMLGPFYTPGAPQRTSVGQGYVLSGVVRSAADCRPVSGALVEFWMAGPDGVYSDDYRASQTVGADGVYRLESHFPPPYSGRPSHIHVKVSAPGYQDLVTQHYPVEGTSQASFDLVIRPQ